MIKPQESRDQDLVVHLVPVFQKDLAAVFKLLADRNGESVSNHSAHKGSSLTPDSAWDEANLRALFTKCKTIHRAILTRMAEAGSVEGCATYEDLRVAGAQASENADFDFDNVRGNLAWISKYMIKVTGAAAGLYTFTDRGAELGTGLRYEYRMPKSIADTWLRIARAS